MSQAGYKIEYSDRYLKIMLNHRATSIDGDSIQECTIGGSDLKVSSHEGASSLCSNR